MRPGFVDGLVLAAITGEDREGSEARAGLAPGLARALRERLQALDALPREARHDEVKRLAALLRRVDDGAALPPRAAAILAPEVSRSLGRSWAAKAPPVRRGFRVSAPLKATLRRLAQPSSPHAERDERQAAGRASETQTRWARRLDADEERVRGALVLGGEGDLAGDERSREWRGAGADLAEVEGAAWRR